MGTSSSICTHASEYTSGCTPARRVGTQTCAGTCTCMCAHMNTQGQHMCTHRTNTLRPPHRHTRGQCTLLSSRRQYTSKPLVAENVDYTSQRFTTLSGVRFPSKTKSLPHSSVSKAQSCQDNPTQRKTSPGKSPRVPRHQPKEGQGGATSLSLYWASLQETLCLLKAGPRP